VNALSPPPGLTFPPSLAENFNRIVHHLQAMVAHAIFMPSFLAQRNAFPQLVLLWKRLNELTDRFARSAAGILPDQAAPRANNPSRSARQGPRRWSNRMPGTVGWLIVLFGAEATELGVELKRLFTSQEFAALLEADPGLARLLRPLCRMVCIERSRRLPPALFAPARAKPPHAPPPQPVAETRNAGPPDAPLASRDGPPASSPPARPTARPPPERPPPVSGRWPPDPDG
jgi:hypothetical protein